jgi:hypothetical protein
MESDHELLISWAPVGKAGEAALTVRLAGQDLAAETVDLLAREKREAFAASLCAEHNGVDAKHLRAKLLRAAGELTDQLGNPNGSNPKPSAETAPDRAALLDKMPKAVVDEARLMLESPDLFKRVADDIGALGVAGERELVATVYLTGVSRLLPQPLAVIVQGPTSSGKSYVIDKVASLFPPEAAIHATQLTPQALFYLKPGSLAHRFVVVGERRRLQDDESADATRALREMLSEGRLSKMLPIKVGGRMETALVQQDGPIAYVESTSVSQVFPEDANRCVLLTTDERPEQTRRILDTLAGVYGGGAGLDVQRIIDRHHATQRMLQSHAVVVPYAARLAEAIDAHRCEARRAFPQVIALIQASALLHQRQRQVDGDGRLLAGPDDYQLARHLLAVPMARQLGGRVSDGALRFLERLRGWFPAATDFTARQAKGREQSSRSAVYDWLSELHDAELIEKPNAPWGNKAAVWRLPADAQDSKARAVLPALESVCA